MDEYIKKLKINYDKNEDEISMNWRDIVSMYIIILRNKLKDVNLYKGLFLSIIIAFLFCIPAFIISNSTPTIAYVTYFSIGLLIGSTLSTYIGYIDLFTVFNIGIVNSTFLTGFVFISLIQDSYYIAFINTPLIIFVLFGYTLHHTLYAGIVEDIR